jgi:hypothetical protein
MDIYSIFVPKRPKLEKKARINETDRYLYIFHDDAEGRPEDRERCIPAVQDGEEALRRFFDMPS